MSPGRTNSGAPSPPAGSSSGPMGRRAATPDRLHSGAALFDLARPDARDDRAVPDASISDYLGIQTNNVAEYTGVVRALDLARELGAREVHLLLDSKLIVEQLAGRWRVKDAKLIPLWTAARKTLAGFDRWSAAHVPRASTPSPTSWPTRRSTGRTPAGRLPWCAARRLTGRVEPDGGVGRLAAMSARPMRAVVAASLIVAFVRRLRARRRGEPDPVGVAGDLGRGDVDGDPRRRSSRRSRAPSRRPHSRRTRSKATDAAATATSGRTSTRAAPSSSARSGRPRWPARSGDRGDGGAVHGRDAGRVVGLDRSAGRMILDGSGGSITFEVASAAGQLRPSTGAG